MLTVEGPPILAITRMRARNRRTLCPQASALILACALTICWTAQCRGGLQGGGVTTFSIYPQLDGTPTPDGVVTLLISMRGGDYPADAVATGRLRVGSGLQILSGDSVHVAHVADSWPGATDNLWRVRVQASGYGSHEVRCEMHSDVNATRVDEMVSRLVLMVDKAGVHAESTETLREETIRNGQRYRLGSMFMVPISGPDEVTSPRIRPGAAVARKVDGICANCKPAELPFLVFVGADGVMQSYEFRASDLDAKGATKEMIAAAEAALRDWRFSPARAGHPVADWIIVRVPVHAP